MRKKNLIIVSMLMIVAIMSIGYAYFATTLNITTTGNISSAWNVKFTNMSAGDANGTKATSLSSSYTDTTATMSVDLKEPGDEMTYELTLTNVGDITAMIEDINAEATGTAAIIFSIDGIKEKDTLAKNETKTIKVKIEFDKNVTSFPSETTKTLTLSIRAVQLVDQDTSNPSIPSINQPMYLSSAILNNNTAQSDSGLDITSATGTGLYYTNVNTENGGTTYYFRGNVENNYVDFGDVKYIPEVYLLGSFSPGTAYINGTCDDSGNCNNKEVCKLSETFSLGSTSFDYVVFENATTSCDNTFGLEEQTVTSTSTGLTYSKENIVEKIYWRIVRINEDGSIRLILEGQGIDWYTGEYTSGDAPNIFLDEVSNWYEENLKTNYSQYLSDSGFCSDMTSMNGTYGSYTRLQVNKKPQFACPRNQDLLTTTNASFGSKTLTNPVGLLSADEVAYAGGGSSTSKTYLPSGLTLSLISLGDYNYDSLYGISSNGVLLNDSIFALAGELYLPLHPVINLRSNILISGGNGTSTNPYVVKTN